MVERRGEYECFPHTASSRDRGDFSVSEAEAESGGVDEGGAGT